MDDGSSDDTHKILLQQNDPRIKVFFEKHRGGNHARNRGLREAKGEYILFLDSDDLLSTDYLENQLNTLRGAPSDSITIAGWEYFFTDVADIQLKSRPIYHDYSSGFELLLDLWKRQEALILSCYLTPVEIIKKAGDWNECLLQNQDGEFFSRVLCHAGRVRFNGRSKAYYRKGIVNSTSSPSPEKIYSRLESYIMYETTAFSVENSLRVRRALACNYSFFISMYWQQYPAYTLQAWNRLKLLRVRTPLVFHYSWRQRCFANIFGLYAMLRFSKHYEDLRKILKLSKIL